jgi:hypothetical protein
MSNLIQKICVFSSLFSVFTTIFLLLLFSYCRQDKFFKVSKDTHIIAVGHSHGSCSLIADNFPGTMNICSGGETYNYTYSKLKTIIDANNQIDTVFLFVSNNLIDDELDTRIRNSGLIHTKLSKYLSIMELSSILSILSINPLATIEAVFLSAKRNIDFLLSGSKTILEYSKWGGYDELKKSINIREPSSVKPKLTSSFTNLFYYKKILSYCYNNKKTLVLISSPIHNNIIFENDYNNRFTEIMNNSLSENVFYLDFRNLQLHDTCFFNSDHLNYNGALIFTDLLKSNWPSILGDSKK